MPYISLSSLAWGMTANGTADAVVLIVLIVFILKELWRCSCTRPVVDGSSLRSEKS